MRTRIVLLICFLSLPLLNGCIVYPHYDERSPAVRGRVVDADTLKPIAGARVAFSTKHSLAAKTDADGRFTIKSTRQWEPLMGVGICGPEYKIGNYYYPEYLDVSSRGHEPLHLRATDNLVPSQSQRDPLKREIYLRDILLRTVVE